MRAATVAMAALVATAGALRLADLNWMPLDPAEAALALGAAGRAVPGVTPPAAPLVKSLVRIVFWLLGTGDAQARLVPAMAGLVAVVGAVRLAPLVGAPAALASAALFALGPAWVFLGRHVSNEMAAAAATVWLVAAIVSRPKTRRWLAPVAAGVLLATGPPAVTVIVAFGLGALVTPGLLTATRLWLAEAWPAEDDRRRAGLLLAGTLVLVAPGALTDPEGIGDVIRTPGAWIQGFGGQGALDTVLALLAYAPLEVGFGLAGIAVAIRRRSRFAGFLGLWTGVAFFVAVATGEPTAIGQVLVPLTLAAGVAIAALAQDLVGGFRWSEEGAMCALLLAVAAFAGLQAVAFAAAPAADDATFVIVVGAVLALGALAVVFMALWGKAVTRRAVGLAALVTLAVLGWSNGARAAYWSRQDLREPLRPVFVAPDAARLEANLREVSWARTKDPYAMDIRVDPALGPTLGWLLRDHGGVRWGGVAKAAVEDSAVVRPVGGEGFGPAAYVGAPFKPRGLWRLGTRGVSGEGEQANRLQSWAKAFARWYMLRLAPGEGRDDDLQFDEVQLYLKVGG